MYVYANVYTLPGVSDRDCYVSDSDLEIQKTSPYSDIRVHVRSVTEQALLRACESKHSF